MRIAYVALHFDARLMKGGIGNKIDSQLRLWCGTGHSARLFLLSRDAMSLDKTEVFPFGSTSGSLIVRFLSREINRVHALNHLINAVRSYQPDIIYLRYGLFSLPLHNLFKIAPVVVEINGNDIDEYRYRGIPFYVANRLTRGIVLGSASSLITVSYDIAQLPHNMAIGKPIHVIGNGVELERYSLLPAPSNPVPVVVMMASPGYSWHGIDKLRDLAVQCPDLKIKIVGFSAGDVTFPVPPNMELLGFMEHSHVRDILVKADAAFGTLALHRKNMQRTSALKVNEALAYGIPLILAYEDTNLIGLQSEFILDLPNTENNIKDHVQQIRDFIYRVKGKRVPRSLIAERIDQREKEKKRLEIFSSILQLPQKGFRNSG